MTIRNIDIKVHPSFLLAVLWVTYFWSGDGLRGYLFGLFILVAVFACVTGHELAHGFVALRYNIAVHDITLLPIGGVARIEQTALTPRREVMIAIAGPLLNIIVALGLFPLVFLIALSRNVHDLFSLLMITQGTDASALILHLWLANVMLALFNLLPAFPMDGGRVLRAALTAMTSRVVATRISVMIGTILAVSLVIAGVYTHDVALPLVAIFILAAAFFEVRMIQVEAALCNIPVGQFALWDLGGVSPKSPLAFAVRGGPRDVVVTDDGIVVGMLWREHVLEAISEGNSVQVRDIMDRDITPMEAGESIYDVHQRMLATGYPAIPITEGGIYRGIFTSERLEHVHRYLHDTFRGSERYRGLARALGLFGR
jgi:Zn-dependent protease